jgi:hypothetical protein
MILPQYIHMISNPKPVWSCHSRFGCQVNRLTCGCFHLFHTINNSSFLIPSIYLREYLLVFEDVCNVFHYNKHTYFKTSKTHTQTSEWSQYVIFNSIIICSQRTPVPIPPRAGKSIHICSIDREYVPMHIENEICGHELSTCQVCAYIVWILHQQLVPWRFGVL